MRRFIYKILVFSLIPLIPFLLIEFGIEAFKKSLFEEITLEKRYKEDANQYAWLEKLDDKPINIVAGSSSVRYDLTCRELNKLNPDTSIYI